MTLDATRTAAKRVLPAPARRWLRNAHQRALLTWAVQRFRRIGPGRPVNAGLIQRLRRGWGNETYSAPSSFLERIAALARNTGGPILECGSGCSTALLGLLAGSRGVEVWSLEHDPRWLKETETRLRRYRIGGVRLVLAPLRSFGDFTWYDAPAGPPFPDRFTLVVCDGPPSMSTQGGRYGLLPLMGHRFAAGTEILLDDARRPEDRAVIDRWISERPLRMELDEAAGRGIAHLTVA